MVEHFETITKNRKKPPEPPKKNSYFPLYWLVHRDPYIIGLSKPLISLTYPKQPGVFSLLTCFQGKFLQQKKTNL